MSSCHDGPTSNGHAVGTRRIHEEGRFPEHSPRPNDRQPCSLREQRGLVQTLPGFRPRIRRGRLSGFIEPNTAHFTRTVASDTHFLQVEPLAAGAPRRVRVTFQVVAD